MEKVTTLTQSYPPNWLGKNTLTIKDGFVLRDWKSLVTEFHTRCDLKNIEVHYDTGRREYNDWDNIAFSILVVFFVFSIVHVKFYITFPIFIFSLVLFATRFAKCDWAYFYDKDHEYVFSIRLAKGDEVAKQFVETVVEEIKNAKQA